MISPHPDTAQKVAEDARRERLSRLAEAHHYPAPMSVIWARFRTGPVARWLEFRALQRMQTASRACQPDSEGGPARVFAEASDSSATARL